MRPSPREPQVARAPDDNISISMQDDANFSDASSDPLSPPPMPQPRPRPWQSAYIKTRAFVRGPVPPVDVDFKPLFPSLQSYPTRSVCLFFKRRWEKAAALVAVWLLWLVCFVVVVHYSSFADTVNGETPSHLTCSATFWLKNDGCGINGTDCEPFADNQFSFRCPASCIASGQVLNPHAVGNESVVYKTFVVGGSPTTNVTTPVYRADSFICPAAIHAGIISDRYGGCGTVYQTGAADSYRSTSKHGITSIGFDSYFPSSYTFIPSRSANCRDLRWHLFIVSIPFTTLFCLIVPSPAIVFATLFVSIYWHVALASDPPSNSDPYSLISTGVGNFLPAAFVAYGLWTLVLSKVHNRLSARQQLEKTILFLGGLWVGALTNITFDVIIPITRLNSHDLEQQPGAKAALAIICIVLFCIFIGQVHYLRLSGQLPGMLVLYIGFGITLGLLAAIPRMGLRIHHYILCLLLLPGTRLRTRPSLLYQGILVGLFINGIARWGFDGIVQTVAELQGDAVIASDTPTFSPPPDINSTTNNVTIHWPPPPANEGWEGVKVLVNDVERFDDGNVTDGGDFSWPWMEGQKLYFRLAYYASENGTGGFTGAGIVEGDGSWVLPEKDLITR